MTIVPFEHAGDASYDRRIITPVMQVAANHNLS
jgi:hypothetical protein